MKNRNILWEFKMYVFVIILLSASVACQDIAFYDYEGTNEGSMCLDNEHVIGNCTVLQECKQALLDIKWKKPLKYCESQGPEVLVCCTLDSFEALASLENLEDCKFQYGRRCEKTQRKSHDACVEYQEMFCPKPKPGAAYDSRPVVSYGENSKEGQFPYMALLGFGNNTSSATWQCAGSIISKTFIITAGHCTGRSDIGPVTFAVVGTLRRSDPIKEGRLYKVKRIIKHPDYRPPHKYNDIALLEMETPITFDDLVRPACLYDGYQRRDDDATIAGWGAMFYKGEGADVLQHARLNKFSDEECSKLYSPSRLLKQGFNSSTQLCYGDYEHPKDTCQGDSGGPLESTSFNFPCVRTVVGVTSFGKSCGHTGVPGIYTRVAAFLPWIESVVWP